MNQSTAQRHYRSPCPGCGAPLEFASAQCTSAVCPYCQSTVVRQGEVLQRQGRMAEVFDDYSPLQLGATGRSPVPPQGGIAQAFSVVGRTQWHSQAGRWSEWLALLDDGSIAFLSEDNGRFVWAWPHDWPSNWPPRFTQADWALGSAHIWQGQPWTVTSVQQVHLLAAQGQWPDLPAQGASFTVLELRSAQGQVCSLDFAAQQCSLGQAVQWDALQMQGLRQTSATTEAARRLTCPNCAASVPLRFNDSQSMVCPSCSSLIDLSQGIGAQLQAVQQKNLPTPVIPLGRSGRLQGVQWQVVGFQRCQGQDTDNEEFTWDEYLLFNQKAGFAFLLDTEDGWQMARITIAAPQVRGGNATYLGGAYRSSLRYQARTLSALGEFYWPVQQGQAVQVHEYSRNNGEWLASETAQGEVTWTHGQAIDPLLLTKAFDLPPLALGKSALLGKQLAQGHKVARWLILLLFVVVVVSLMRCTQPPCDPATDVNCSTSRSSAGAYRGWTSGGSHK